MEKRVPVRHLLAQILVAAAVTETALEVVTADLPADAVVRASGPHALLRQALGEEGDELLFALELLISEVVTNAVRHASSAPRIEAHLGPDTVRVAVYDDDPALPSTGSPIWAVRAVGASTCSTRSPPGGAPSRSDQGKVVWFEIDRPAVGPAPAG